MSTSPPSPSPGAGPGAPGRPLVSVVVPVHDGAALVASAVERVLSQRDADIELVVVDDGSRDGSTALVRAAGADPRVTAVVLEENVGVARARRRGVEAARGEWVWFVDSDDDAPLDAVASLLSAASADVDVVVGAATLTGVKGASRRMTPPGAGRPAAGEPPLSAAEAVQSLLQGRVTGHLWNKLFRRSLLLGIVFTPARTQSDLAMTAQALAAARGVAVVDVVVYHYVKRPGSVITTPTKRAESLALVSAAVETAAREVGLHAAAPDDLAYYRIRYVALSGIKDALLAGYSREESRRLVERLRPHLDRRALALLVRRRDWRRLVLACTARRSLWAHRLVLAVADR